MPSVMLIGPVAKDIIIKNDYRYKSIGGAVFYQSHVLSSLKINCKALITISKNDEELLHSFPEDVELIPVYVNETINFHNIYPDEDPNHRIQKACVPDNPIESVSDRIKSSDIILLGPLCPYDIPLKTIKELSKLNKPIYLGAQGYLRHLINNEVILKPWQSYKNYLKYIDILFIDENESAIILGEKHPLYETAEILTSFGPREVIITCGSRGSLIYSKELNKSFKVPAFKPEKIEDPTGLGDTYMAAYASYKFKTEDPVKCGRFAAAAASIKLQNKGPFKGNKKLIEARCKF